MVELAVIGGGPAGLRVAELTAEAGIGVHLYDQMRSAGRKFLVAGKSGLNLTNDANRDDFLLTYQGRDLPTDLWAQIYDRFDNDALREWARMLGQETFVSSGKKVFPQSMKAAPLLRPWIKKIQENGGQIHVSHSLRSIARSEEGYALTFQLREGVKTVIARQVVLALGGGSWSRTGSDGKWTDLLSPLGIPVNPLTAANCGWETPWAEKFLAEHEGTPWKNIICTAGAHSVKGELVITQYGLEGGPIYRLGHALRQQPSPTLQIDFKPDFSAEQLIKKAESVRRNLSAELPHRWKVPQSVIDLLEHQFPESFRAQKVTDITPLANAIKQVKIPLTSPRPIDEAISTAGGIAWEALDGSLQLRDYLHLYACGEMLDWEAPTGGFLLQGCLSTATWVSDAIIKNALSQ